MTTRAYLTALVISLASLCGCAPVVQSRPPEIPPPEITSAKFQLGQPYTVVIVGEFFKIKSDNKKDVVVSLNGRNWIAATSISESSPTSYTAVLPYGVSFPQVWVRVYGIDEEYSQPMLVQVGGAQ
jgi:hypothetical protein